MGACAGSAWGQDDLSHPGLLWYCLISSAKILTLRWDSPLGPEQGTTPCQCREMYPSTLCLLSGYQSTGMPAQHLSKFLNNFFFFSFNEWFPFDPRLWDKIRCVKLFTVYMSEMGMQDVKDIFSEMLQRLSHFLVGTFYFSWKWFCLLCCNCTSCLSHQFWSLLCVMG